MTSGSLLQGGKRRRRPGLLIVAALLLAAGAVAAAVLLALGGDEGAAGRVAVQDVPRLTREPSPPVEEEPTSDVPLNGVDAFGLRMRKPPRAALLFDVDSGEVLWRRRPLAPAPVASLTKIMTAVLATERAKPGARVRITRRALRYRGSGVGVLPKGKRVRLETLVNGLMLVSGNDAAIALAEHVAGSQGRFVSLMNERARGMGLTCTRFADAHGLSRRNRSCARDLAALSRLAMSNRRIARIVRRRQVAFRFPIKGGRLYLSGHNPLIRAGYAGAIGLKTGYTRQAGRCFVGVARRNGRTLGVVLLSSPNPLKHATRLLDEGFTSLSQRP